MFFIFICTSLCIKQDKKKLQNKTKNSQLKHGNIPMKPYIFTLKISIFYTTVTQEIILD